MPPKEIDVFGRNNAGKLHDRQSHGRFAHIVSHLQRLNEKLSLNDSPHASLEIKCIATAPPFGPDSMQHRVDLLKEIRIAAGDGPGRVRDRPEAFLVWPGYWAGTGKRLNSQS